MLLSGTADTGLDGANWWQKFRVVTLPSIIPELLVVILTATIGALKTFAPVYLLTKGGPGTATTVPSYYSYNQFFQVQQVGYGAAISTALTVVIIVFSIVFTMVQKHVEKELVVCETPENFLPNAHTLQT